MKCRKSTIIMMLVIFLFAVAGVCASDVNDTEIADEDLNGELSSVDALAMPNDDDLRSAQEDGEIEFSTSSQDENPKLAFEMGDFDILQALVYDPPDSIVSLERNYTYNNSDTITEGIMIVKPITINGNGFTIDAKGKSRIFKVTAGSLNITNITLKNGKAEVGAAIFFENDISNSNIDGAFIDNYADLSAGAICFDCVVKDSNIGGTYINNYGMYGGANRFLDTLKNSNVTGTYIHNAAMLGGANDFLYEVTDSRIDGTYINNTSIGEPNSHGGANNFFWIVTGCTVTGTYINNLAGQKGGAIHFNRKVSATKISGIYINNTARSDGVISFKNVPPDAVISNGVFLDNTCTNVIWAENPGVTAENNWFGNNETNCRAKPNVVGVEMDKWLFLTGEYAMDEFRFFLKSYNGTDASDYDNSLVSDINLTVSAANGAVDKAIAKLEEPIGFTPVSSGTATVTASIENAAQTVEIQVKGEFDLLQELVSDESLSVINLERNYTYNKSDTMREGIRINRAITINGNGFVIDAKGKSRIFHIEASGVIIKNLTFKNAYYDGVGGAIRFDGSGSVMDCSFINNSARYGGAIDFDGAGNITNCSFDENNAGDNDGGALWIYSGTVRNCNFTANHAFSRGGGIYILTNGNVSNCNFCDNDAREGGAVVIRKNGDIINCNFTDNNAKIGGAVYFNDKGEVTHSNFTGNYASGVDGGGAVYMNSGGVRYCSFTDNHATSNGGAILVDGDFNLTDCNFTDNSAVLGGAIDFQAAGSVENCIFTENIASSGSAIYFKSDSGTKTISNSTFLNNRADADADLTVIVNENNIEIIFTGRDNLINAIYSNGDVNFTNVSYWGEMGIANTDSSAPSRSNREAGQNITVAVVVNDGLLLNDVKVTDANGTIVLDIKSGDNYYITLCHDSDSYYTEAETTLANIKFHADVDEIKTTNRTVNITAKSNIHNEIIPGGLTFILPDGRQINATYASGGIWWAVHTFDDYGDYNINATYAGLDNVEVNNATVSIFKADSALNITDIALDYGDSAIVTVEARGATGIIAKINSIPVTVLNNYVIPISGLDIGLYTLTVTTIPDDDHNSVTRNVTITVSKHKTQITANAVTTTYNVDRDLVITLRDAKGNALTEFSVTVDLGGVKAYTTDKNGQIRINVGKIIPNTYTAKITFNGDNKYLGSSAAVKVTVKKAKAKITAKKKTFKKSKKVKKYRVGLKDSNGNPIKNVKLTLKVKGKTYNAKTNSKGKATFKIKLTKKGNHKATIRFKGNACYIKAAKKVKIKIR